jgi:flagellar basal-body rod modification protein FlgD
MAVDSISKSSLSIQDFLRILTSQLNNQDPLKPMDNQEFVAQLAQFTTLQQTQQLNDKIDSLLSIQSATQSVGLIGRSVELNTASGQQSGRVTALDFSSGQPQLSVTLSSGSVLDGISLSNLIRVF